mmetsp:Transcript_1223/g.1874  ORF Transcript_1223/g.1874 Transcript_1223/m.1874 type:complete len:379 (+) Transcript_1223:57-1193(+)
MMSTMTGPSADNAIGMMDAAYFTSRKDILDWLNTTLELKLTKIEQTASGAVACQIIEYVFPGSIPMHRVDWEARSDFEFIQNYKLLQAAFTKHRIQRHVDVDKLIRAKYQDNLEFMQWLKAFFDQAAPRFREGYDPVATRAKGKGGKAANQIFSKNSSQFGSKLLPTDRSSSATARVAKAASKENVVNLLNSTAANIRSNAVSSAASSRIAPASSSPKRRKDVASPSSSFNTEQIIADAKLLKRNEELASKNLELDSALGNAEKERDFYFDKLRRIEKALEKAGDSPTRDHPLWIKRISNILYDQEDNDEEETAATSDDAPAFQEPEFSNNQNEIVAEDPHPLKLSANASVADKSYYSYADEDFLDDDLLTAEEDDAR